MSNLPLGYISYLKSEKLTCGFTDLEFGGYFVLEPIVEIEKYNDEIEIEKYAPGFIAFASNGGGEVLAFDAEGKIYSLPLIGMSSECAVLVAESWQDYERHIEVRT